MSILSDFEKRVSQAVEGMFAGVFRSPVQPAELARAAAKEMDRGRKLGVGKVYAPTLYNVLLSRDDDDQLGGFAETLAGELETYLVSHARERGYTLAVRPVVRFLVDEDLRMGRFEIIGELMSPEELAAEFGPEVDAADAPIAENPVHEPEPLNIPGDDGESHPGLAALVRPLEPQTPVVRAAAPKSAGLSHGSLATVTVRGVDHDVVLRGGAVVVGRLKTCDICLHDANASRKHAAFVAEGGVWVIEDLGSTNGTLLNGQPVQRAHLADGDVVTIGVTDLVFHAAKAG